jgi:hypothetical protein
MIPKFKRGDIIQYSYEVEGKDELKVQRVLADPNVYDDIYEMIYVYSSNPEYIGTKVSYSAAYIDKYYNLIEEEEEII